MRLRTLGGLGLGDSGFGQHQAKILLAYLGLEGKKERTHLAELFWPGARRPLNNLSSAISRIRAIEPSLIEADRLTVAATVDVDVTVLADRILDGELAAALSLYQGRFLDGVDLDRLRPELQEWVLERRELSAASARDAAVRLAVDAARSGQLSAAARHAEAALVIGVDAIPDAEKTAVLHPILLAAGSASAARLAMEAEDYGVDLPSELPPRIEAAGAAGHRTESSFFGRDDELSEVAQVLGPGDPILISGLGGVGKSRLANRAMTALLDRCGPGYWIDLVNVHSIDHVAEAVRSIVVPDVEQVDDLASVAAAIGDRRGVLVLDYFEQLAADGEALRPLFTVCTQLSVIITSRSGLPLPELRHNLVLHGLPVEGLGGEGIGPAVELFRAAVRRHGFVVADLDTHHAVEICRLLHGHPLALELVAGWSCVLSMVEVVEELADGFDLVATDNPAYPDHHRSHSVVMARSWELLDSDSREAMDRLAVFPAGFDRAAAEEVAGCDLATLRRLVERSLLRRAESGLFLRHPLVVHHASERLASQPTAESEARTAHARYLVDLLEHQGGGDPADVIAIDSVEDEVENLLRAWRWCARNPATCADLLTSLADPLCRRLGELGRHQQALDELNAVFAEPVEGGEVHEMTAATVLMQQSWLHMVLGRYDLARQLAEQALTGNLAEAPSLLVELTRVLAVVERHEGRVEAAVELLSGLAGVLETTPSRLQRLVMEDLGHCRLVLGDLDGALEVYRSALALAQVDGSAFGEARCRLFIGIAQLDAGSAAEAVSWLRSASRVATENELEAILPYIDSKLAISHLALSDSEAASRALDEAKERLDLVAERWLTVELHVTAARLAASEGQRLLLAENLRSAIAIAVEINDAPFILSSFFWVVELCRGPADLSDVERRLLIAVSKHEASDDIDRRRASALLPSSPEGSGVADEPLALVPDALAVVDVYSREPASDPSLSHCSNQ